MRRRFAAHWPTLWRMFGLRPFDAPTLTLIEALVVLAWIDGRERDE